MIAALLLASLTLPLGASPAEAAADTPATARPVTRLDARVRPLSLEIRLDVDPDRDTLSGLVTFDVVLPERTRVVRLHGRNLDVRRARVEGGPAQWTQLDDEGTAELRAEREVGPGEVRIEVEYKAKLSTTLEGAFLVESEGRKYVATQLEAISARDVFPCFDEPGFKQPIALTLFVDDGDVAVANTPEVARAQLPDGRVRVTFARSEPLPAYLVAFAVGPFDIVEGETLAPAATRKRPLPLRAIVPKGQGAKLKKALEVTAHAVRTMERLTGHGYPFAKLDFVAVPQFAWGGMENAGLIVYSDARISFDDSAGIEQEKLVWGLVSHEVAHQWFGDLVTMKWWDDTWLNEAFATWAAYRVVEENRPDLLSRVAFRNRTHRVFDEDALLSARQVREPVITRADIFDSFDGVTYVKGASVIRMFEGYVGRERFARGIRAYLSEHRYGNADARDLIDAVSRNARVDLSRAFFTFLDQPGVPYLDARLACDGAPRLIVRSSRFLPVGTSAPRAQQWITPVCASVDGREHCALVEGEEAAIDLGPGCPKAVLPDAGGRGYYRFALSAEQLRPLVDGRARLSTEERLAVTDAIRAGLDSARLSYADALALALPLAADDNPHVARTPLELLAFAIQVLDDDKARSRARARVRELYAPVLARLERPDDKGSARPPETPEQRELRLLAARALVGVAEDRAAQQSRVGVARLRFGLITGTMEASAAPADLTDVYGAALVAQDPAAFDALLARLAREEDTDNRKDLFAALGAATDPAAARRGLDAVLGPTLRIHERVTLLEAYAADRRTRPVAFEWIEKNIDALAAVVPESALGDVALAFAPACSETEAARLDALLRPRTDRWPIARPLAQALERIRLCAAKKAAHDASLKQAFAR